MGEKVIIKKLFASSQTFSSDDKPDQGNGLTNVNNRYYIIDRDGKNKRVQNGQQSLVNIVGTNIRTFC